MNIKKNNGESLNGDVGLGFDEDFSFDDDIVDDGENFINFDNDSDEPQNFMSDIQDTSGDVLRSEESVEEMVTESSDEDEYDYRLEDDTDDDFTPEDFEQDEESSNDVEVEETDGQSRVAYLITDRENPNLLGYYRSLGININNIFYNFKDLRTALLMQTEPSRIILVETGAGKFTSLKNRKVMTDILGLCDGTVKASVFYTDSVVRSDSKYELGKNKHIKWIKYISTAGVVLHMLRLKETYIYDDPEEEKGEISPDEAYRKIGMQMPMNKMDDIGPNIITKGLLAINMMESSENLLEEYVPRI